ncbi:uncharacterized protein LOC124353134 [Homalodisca vitripennis]|uniref:uncharacterized protein LOC124353134 n=1 Tax=Homalodisca vitripennis TaxID=197043 RepID=UPI001EEAEAD2|nr:uncharacterized protein LOC124353134 [Homalodisca vitripennis]
MSHDLSPWNHISRICSKANSLMGFLCRTSKDFQSPTTLTTLFKTLVCPILEFSSVVWCPYLTGHIDTLERVQIRFLRLIGLRLGYQFLETPVDCLRISLGLPHLATRRRMADILILHKMVNGALDCPRLLSLLEFRIPTSTRSGDIFFKRALPSLYSYYSCIPRLMREGNEVSGGVEFFGSSYQSFRSRLGKLL